MSLIVNILIVFSILSCEQTNNEQLITEDFSITYPSNLELDESGQEGTIFILTAQKENEADVFVENINLATKKVGNMSFNEFTTKTEKEIKSVGRVVENERFKTNGRDCLRLVIEISQNNIELTFIQHYYVANQKAYVLTFSSERKVFDKYFDEMNDVMMSFKIK